MDQQFENSARWAAAAQNLDFAMQEYLLLQDQHEELCQRLHELSPLSSSSSSSLSATTKTSPSSLAPTTATSPSISSTRSVRDGPAPSRDQRTTSHTYRARTNQREAVRNESLVGEVAAGERKLFDVNEGMKRALTELLNCEVVRQDRAMRTWVQTRLLETEKELRRERRRRSSATVD
ncbi:hypothetical protein GGS24DRAFT_503724 [Hypoxylon argillaceum]|nr:hypothetical protein GGS24DRAFT_503724 [Hypoxylon argillaceum]